MNIHFRTSSFVIFPYIYIYEVTCRIQCNKTRTTTTVAAKKNRKLVKIIATQILFHTNRQTKRIVID